MQEETKDSAKVELHSECVRKFEQAFADKQNMAYAVLQSLNFVVKQSSETTIQAMYEEIRECADVVLNSIRNSDSLGDRTLLSLQCLIKIYFRMAQKENFEQGIEGIKSAIHLKGISLA